jgi:hypothetical protein
MTHVYRSAPVAAESGGNPVVVVHCSDPRYQPHFQDFLRGGLKLERYALVAVPGGPQCFTIAQYLPKFAWAGWRWMKFLVKLMKPSRVILIAHDDCRWYIDNRFASASDARARQVDDLRRAQKDIVDRFGAIPIDVFYATLTDGVAHFERVQFLPPRAAH